MKKTSEEYEIGIRRVKELAFMLDEQALLKTKEIRMNIQLEMTFDLNVEDITMHLGAALINDENFPTASIETANTFVLKNLLQFQNPKRKDQLDLPEEILILMFSISFSHSRALMARHLNGTALENMVLPIISPKAVLKTLNIETKDATPQLQKPAKKKVSSKV